MMTKHIKKTFQCLRIAMLNFTVLLFSLCARTVARERTLLSYSNHFKIKVTDKEVAN
jgi:hypothetical protein